MLDPVLEARIAILVAIALVYMLFDVFNRRNVPSMFAYGTLVVGALVTLFFSASLYAMGVSFGIAAIVCGVGYVVYRAGQLGAADVIEFAAISMILPIQQTPLLASYQQFGLPFALSMFIGTGVVALLLIPLYYLPRAQGMLGRKLRDMVSRRDIFKGTATLAAYFAFGLFLVYNIPLSTAGITLLLVMCIGSFATILFERPITDSMIEYIPVNKFEDGDIIALNLMKNSEISSIRARVHGFDRLITNKLIELMKKKKIKARFPVYRDAMPLALPIFIGVVLSLLFGNLMLLIIS